MKTKTTYKHAKDCLDFWQGVLKYTYLPEHQNIKDIQEYRSWIQGGIDSWSKYIEENF